MVANTSYIILRQKCPCVILLLVATVGGAIGDCMTLTFIITQAPGILTAAGAVLLGLSQLIWSIRRPTA